MKEVGVKLGGNSNDDKLLTLKRISGSRTSGFRKSSINAASNKFDLTETRTGSQEPTVNLKTEFSTQHGGVRGQHHDTSVTTLMDPNLTMTPPPESILPMMPATLETMEAQPQY